MRRTKQELRNRRRIRVRARISGTPEKPRISVFRSLTNFEAQFIDDVNGKTIFGMSTRKEKIGKTVEAAKKLGIEFAKKAKEAKISACVFDRKGYTFHGRVKAFAEGAREGGLQF